LKAYKKSADTTITITDNQPSTN